MNFSILYLDEKPIGDLQVWREARRRMLFRDNKIVIPPISKHHLIYHTGCTVSGRRCFFDNTGLFWEISCPYRIIFG